MYIHSVSFLSGMVSKLYGVYIAIISSRHTYPCDIYDFTGTSLIPRNFIMGYAKKGSSVFGLLQGRETDLKEGADWLETTK